METHLKYKLKLLLQKITNNYYQNDNLQQTETDNNEHDIFLMIDELIENSEKLKQKIEALKSRIKDLKIKNMN